MRTIDRVPPGAAHAYLDESGNSGPNLLDDSQPVYVLAGWIVREQGLHAAEQVVKDMASALGLKAKELHGTRILRNRRGQRAFTGFIRSMGAAGALPVFSINEKRYWIAGKAVETFLDHVYNKAVPAAFYNDILAKQKVADEIGQLPNEYLEQFADAYRLHDPIKLSDSALRLASVFELKGQREIATWLRSAPECLPEVSQLERDADRHLPGGALGTVNIPVFASFCSLLEAFARQANYTELRIFHDQSKEFAQGYDWALKVQFGQGVAGGEVQLPNDRTIFFGFEKIKSLKMLDSETCLLIQAADLLAYGLARYSKFVVAGTEPPGWLKEALELIVISVALRDYFPDMPRLGELLGTPAFLGRILATAARGAKAQSLSQRESSG